jgi:hypothetical protein
VDGLINENFGIQEEASMNGVDLLFGGKIFDGIRVVEMEEVPVVEKNKVGVLEDKMFIHQPMDAPHSIRFWNTEEHRLLIYHPFRIFLNSI